MKRIPKAIVAGLAISSLAVTLSTGAAGLAAAGETGTAAIWDCQTGDLVFGAGGWARCESGSGQVRAFIECDGWAWTTYYKRGPWKGIQQSSYAWCDDGDKVVAGGYGYETLSW